MKTKIVYCLVSDTCDWYYEQLIVSLYSLRIHNPESYVAVVCDINTYNTLNGPRASVRNYADEVIPIEVDEGASPMVRSRYLKTNLRHLVDGDYLFVDTDTIVSGSLDFIDDFDCSIAMAPDGNEYLKTGKMAVGRGNDYTSRYASIAGVDIHDMIVYNSGVIYVKDHPDAYRLYSEWNRIYKEHLVKNGIQTDQFSLCLANEELGRPVELLPPSLNCQMHSSTHSLIFPSAVIIHFTGDKLRYQLTQTTTLAYIKETGKVSEPITHILKNFKKDPLQKFSIIPWETIYFLVSNGKVMLYMIESHHWIFMFFRKISEFIMKIDRLSGKEVGMS